MKKVTYDQATKAVAENDGNVTQAAKSLGISRAYFRSILAEGTSTLSNLDEHKLKVEIKHLKDKLNTTLNEVSKEVDLLNVANTAATTPLDPPAWLSTVDTDEESAIACSILSDTHFDEVVDPSQIGYANAYNREIAIERLQAYFKNLIGICDHHMNGFNLEGLVVALAGDMISGNIHDELRISNEADVIETSLFWSEQIAAGFELCLDHFDDIYVPCVVGNHGRNTQKPQSKGRARSSFDWLIYKLLEKHFKNTPEITFDVSDSADLPFKVYNTRYMLTHGDQAKGGSGWMGALGPLMRLHQKKLTRESYLEASFDVMLAGHWHQLIYLDHLVVNGSLKGLDEFAYHGNFKPEPPRQAFWITTPRLYKTMQSPIICTGASEK